MDRHQVEGRPNTLHCCERDMNISMGPDDDLLGIEMHLSSTQVMYCWQSVIKAMWLTCDCQLKLHGMINYKIPVDRFKISFCPTLIMYFPKVFPCGKYEINWMYIRISQKIYVLHLLPGHAHFYNILSLTWILWYI
jgi:hypothetical protein